MELILGCRNKADLRAVDRFLSHFTAIPLNTQISDTAIGLLKRYYLSHGLLMADALIAATAEWMQCSLLSKNWRDYRFIEGISLIEYPPSS
jgi:predicted nucleic acid-binding protein